MKKNLLLLIIVILTFNFPLSTLFAQTDRQKDWAGFEYYAAQNDSILAAKAKTTVVFYGNSITRNWYKMRRQFFIDNGFTGRGIGGQTSAELLVRMRQDVIDLHPKTVVIMCGTNDIARNNGTISIDHTLGNIISMCELAKANKIRPVLCSVLPARSFRWNPFVYDAPAQIRELNAKIRAYAERNKITYVDYPRFALTPNVTKSPMWTTTAPWLTLTAD